MFMAGAVSVEYGRPTFKAQIKKFIQNARFNGPAFPSSGDANC
jgi:hypothetical protein